MGSAALAAAPAAPESYADRKGYDPGFLGKGSLAVQLPRLSKALTGQAARLTVPQGANSTVLHYRNYSAVVHAKRRLAIYSAANVDFAGRYDMGRPPDVWKVDPRIPEDQQLGGDYYVANQFDRGHLTRREDLEFGSTRDIALASAADTCHWTNCTPQHRFFNQNKELWQGLERHLLEDGVKRDRFKAQIITGPVLDASDPVWKKFPTVQYPVKFWKVVAAVRADGQLMSSAYLLDQSDVIARYGIEGLAGPLTPFKTFQVPVAEVERITGLTFWSGPASKPVSLSTYDPLAGKKPAAVANVEQGSIADAPDRGYVRLHSCADLVLST